MVIDRWSKVIQQWFGRGTRGKVRARNAIAQRSQQVSQRGIEHLEDRALLSALSISDVSVVEGDAGTTNAVFTVTLDAADPGTVTVVASSSDGTASVGSDYVLLPPTTLTFAPGETSKTVTVLVNGDASVEADETFFVNLSNANNATLGDAQGIGTITNDDGTIIPTLSITDVTTVEGNAGTSNAVFTISLSAASAQTVTVVATSSNDSATAGSDYVALPATTVTFAPGEVTKTITIAINGDTDVEGNEAYNVSLTTPVNATISDAQGLGIITNDDGVSVPTLSIDNVATVEGNSGTTNAVFTVTLSAASAQTVTVVATSSDDTASAATDYIALAPTTLTFLPGELTKTITVAINGDNLVEANEAYNITLTNAVNATLADGAGLGTITNDDGVAGTISINDVSIVEGNSGTANAVFTVTLSAASAQIVTVVAASADGTASVGSDYVALSPTTLTFAPGETTKTVTVAVNGDITVEGDETVLVNLSAPTNTTISDAQGVGTITNDDGVVAGSLSIGDVSVVEGNAGTTNAVFTVTLSAASAQTVTVVAASANGTASQGSDYIALAPTTLTFLPGETTKTVTVAVNGDTTVEGNETFLVDLTAPTNTTISDAQAIGTITNDDGIVGTTISVNNVSVVEGNSGTTNAVFTVSLSAASAQTVTVIATSADGTASLASDYVALAPTTLTFLPGETTKTVTVAVNGDLTVEPNETFQVNLTTPVNATILDAQGLGTITNDDVTGSPTISIADVTVLEGNAGTTNSVFTVTLSEASAQTVTVLVSSANGTASFGTDYVALPAQTLTFLPGETTKQVTVVVNGDTTVEADETLFVNLSAASNATVVDNQGLGTIINDDNAVSGLSISDVSVVEGDAGTTNAVFTVTLGAASAQAVTVVATSADGTATLGADYIALPATTLTFLPGETSKTVTVAVNGDVLVESNETFFINLTGAVNATVSDAQGVGTITNDDSDIAVATIVIGSPQSNAQVKQRPAVIANNASLTYIGTSNPDFSSATLTVSIVSGRQRGDQLGLLKGSSSDAIYTRGKKVFSGSTQIGTFVRGRNDRNPNLVVRLNSSATTTDVNNLLNRTTFRARTGAGTNRNLTYQLTNIGGVDSNAAPHEIVVTG